MARPKKIQDSDKEELVKKFKEYITETNIPIIAEFAYMNGIDRTYLYDNKEFSTLLKTCIAKKEAQLEKLSLEGKINTTQAIFSLKQLGWRDKQEIESTNHNLNQDITNMTEEEVDAELKKYGVKV